jgi:uncharacterized protein (TIGR03435 family)
LPKHSGQLIISIISFLMFQSSSQFRIYSLLAVYPSKFDVATVRQSPDRSNQSGAWMGIRVTADTFEARNVTLMALVRFAYADRSKGELVSGGGGWIESRDWDVVAKVDDPSMAALSDRERSNRMRPFVQALLSERFNLRLHPERRLTAVYALRQAKGGAKVKEVPAPPPVDGDLHEALERFREDNPGKLFPGAITCGRNGCSAKAVSMSTALRQIQGSSHSDRMVIDETGLNGYYDFSFRNPGEEDQDAMGKIEEDLGMIFESRKTDLTTYVIDSAELPSPN